MASSDPGDGRDTRVLLLVPEDNVYCACVDIPAGSEIEMDGRAVAVGEDIPTGFKIAREDLKAGEKIFKYGAPIGSLTEDVPRGAIIHTHNLKSDYLPTYTLTGDTRFTESEQ
jgi:hypothetical protein